MFINHSGGCPGADMAWETIGKQYGVKTIAYSFQGHVQEGENPRILTPTELNEGLTMVIRANKVMKRSPETQSRYVKGLLSRNWFQVKNSEAVFAIAKSFQSPVIVEGGTGWAVQMAIDSGKPVYVFEQTSNRWAWYHYADKIFVFTDKIPTLTKNFAGIGTRDLTDGGEQAIQDIYKKTFLPLRLEVLNHESSKVVYIEEYPFIKVSENGDIDVITPNSWTIYNNNKEFVDDWLRKHNISLEKLISELES